MRYETGLVEAEADYFRLVRRKAPDVCVPDVVAAGTAPAWLFTARLPGVPLSQLGDGVETAGVREELGRAVAAIHRVTGRRYGYTGDRPHALLLLLEYRDGLFRGLLRAAASFADDELDLSARICPLRL